ncbi:LysM domain-containing protein/F-box-like domain-containing protein [Cephalotus follicularis]|uniref:LysM domain-containing protein/F-box-like domain-containing protein n=1 Tax=Cephalotus follicularis TaxID=3775 RepID=A0A1Q3B5K4_CEPFO|nr:LysM domain-containing protein/F-box-like domain-containing protein [Cephalotus follicularis]
MNSLSSVLACRDTLQLIFEKLTIPDLSRASCVCRAWKSVVSDHQMVSRAFGRPWNLGDIVGEPLSRSFWRDNGIGKFAISHRILGGDSVASLAVKYSVQVMDIKRLNNMMSDHGINSRERLLIPISNPGLLINGTCYIELDTHAKREVAVLYLDDEPNRKTNYLMNRVNSDQGKRRLINSIKRSMQADDGTAQYYLSISNGDPRAALSEFSEDLRWERKVGMT